MTKKVFTWLGRISEKKPWWVIAVVLLITAVAAGGMARIKSEFSYKSMLPKGIESVVALNESEEIFGGTSEEQVLVVAPDVLDGAVLRRTVDYARDIEKQKEFWPSFVNEVITPLDGMRYFPTGASAEATGSGLTAKPAAAASSVQAEPLMVKAGSLSDEELARQVELNLEAAEARAERLGLGARSDSISDDDRALLIRVKLNPGAETGRQMKLAGEFEEWSREQFAGLEDAETFVGGMASLNKDANDRTMKDMRLLFVLAFLFIIAVLLITFRRVSDVLLTLFVIVVTIVWVIGFGSWLGFPLTYTSSAIIPLLLGIDIAYAIHVLSRYYEERRKGSNPHKSALTSVATVGIAVFLTAATTAFGFASFSISNMPPIQQFGAQCVGGVAFSFLLAVTLLPACLVIRDRRKKSLEKWDGRYEKRNRSGRRGVVDRLLVGPAVVAEHHRKIVFAVTALLLAGCVFLGTQISTEADMQKMMPADTPSAVAQARVNDYFGGQDIAYTLVKGQVLEPDTLNAMLEYEDDLAASGATSEDGEPLFERDRMFSLADLVSRANNGSIPATRQQVISLLMSLSNGSESQSSNRLLNPEHPDVTMITIRVERGPEKDLEKLTEAMRAENRKIMRELPGLDLTTSGMPALISDMMGSLVPTQLKTSGAALLLCLLIVTLVFGSLFFGLAATSVVFIGIALEIGTLVLLKWPLDFMTVMVSSLVIGAGIDFGIHLTHRFREEWHHGGVEIDEAMRRTVGNVGKALLAAAITTAGAFGIIAISQISYMRRFGGITALSLAFALLASLLVLPSILAWRASATEKKREKRLEKKREKEREREAAEASSS